MDEIFKTHWWGKDGGNSCKKENLAGQKSVLADLLNTGDDALHMICNKILQSGEWPTTKTQSFVIPLPKRGNLQQRKNYCTISLISHLGKVLLKGIMNRLKPQVEQSLAEKQAEFGAGQNTMEQIFNLGIICKDAFY